MTSIYILLSIALQCVGLVGIYQRADSAVPGRRAAMVVFAAMVLLGLVSLFFHLTPSHF